MTPLDIAHDAMETASEDASARLRFYDCLAGAELFLLLADEAEGDAIRPQIFPIEGQSLVLAFDQEERLSAFVDGAAAPYAVLTGRCLAEMLASQSMGLGLNLGVAPSAIILDAEAMTWLAETLSARPDEVEETPEELSAPVGVPEPVLTAIDSKLAAAGGLAKMAYLALAQYAGGRTAHLVAFIDPLPGAEPALANAVTEALTFSGIEAGSLDIAFFKASDQVAASLARVGLRFDLPEAEAKSQTPGAAPGMDPSKPPKLR